MPKTGPIDKSKLWKPGQSGNPGGRSKFLLSVEGVKTAIGKHAHMTIGELGQVLTNPETKSMDAMIASIMLKAIKDADCNRFQFLLDRAIGKVKDVVEIAASRLDEAEERIPPEKVAEFLRSVVKAAA